MHELRKPIIAGNWKMNTTYAEAVSLAQEVVDQEKKSWKNADIILCPPFTALRGVSNVIAFDKSTLSVGAQDVSPFDDGAYTGEISWRMIADLDATYCLVGHSERREIMGDTDELIKSKITTLLEHNIAPVLCVGEPHEIYEQEATVEYVTKQVASALSGLSRSDIQQIIVAYEPIWAIGTGEVPTPEHADMVASEIRETVAQLTDENTAQDMRILYGGSVQPGNVSLFTSKDGVDGVLVGGCSLQSADFVEIINNVIASKA